eukprot:g20569.t1
MRVLPVIRCPPGDAAEMIAVRLEDRIRELLNRSGGVASELFAAGGRAGAEVPGAASRPLLIILDRDIDLVTMLSHTWTYQAMVHDVLGMRLNKMQVPVESDDASAPPKARSYDVDDQDSFWTAHAGDQFPEVLNAVPKAIEETSTAGALTEKKRSIDMHTNIAHALVAEVKARELDRYYELEDQLPSQSLGNHSLGVDQAEHLAAAAAGPSGGLRKHWRRCLCSEVLAVPEDHPNHGHAQHHLNCNDSWDEWDAGGSFRRNIVASKKELAICQIVEALMEQKQGGVTENYLYFDPKAPATARGADVPRIRAPFRRAMTFVVGGGNYVEHQSLQDWAQNSGRQVTYGSTDMVSPVQFVDELSHLGQTLGQGQSGGMPDLS